MLARQRVRGLGWKPDKPDHRDFRRKAAPVGEMPTHGVLPGAELYLPILRDQGDQGSCTGFSTAGAAYYKRLSAGQDDIDLSPRFIYYNARVIEGTTGQDAGAEIRSAIKGVTKLGCANEILCPYSDEVFRQRPSAEAYADALDDVVAQYTRIENADAGQVKAEIMAGNPVVFGISLFDNFDTEQTARDGLIPMPDGPMDGGHAAFIVGYDDRLPIHDELGGFLAANSWGPDWGAEGPDGRRGYFWLPYAYASNKDLADDFWAIERVT